MPETVTRRDHAVRCCCRASHIVDPCISRSNFQTNEINLIYFNDLKALRSMGYRLCVKTIDDVGNQYLNSLATTAFRKK